MKTKSKIFTLIFDHVKNEKLKIVIDKHFNKDEWNILDELENIKKEDLNVFDQKVKDAFLCRVSSLIFKYNLVKPLLDEIDAIINGLDKEDYELALKGFIYHNYAIVLGYMGKARSIEYSLYIEQAEGIYNTLETGYDLALLRLHKMDVEVYYSKAGYIRLIKALKVMFNNAPEAIMDQCPFRIGLLYLLTYLRYPEGPNPEFLHKAKKWLTIALEKSSYKDTWAKYGLVVVKHYLNEDEIKTDLVKPSEGYRVKAMRFPMVWLLFIKAERILGGENKDKRLVLNAERIISKLIRILPEDEEYITFILDNYGMIIEDCLIHYGMDNTMEIGERFRRMIRSNEIIQNRPMTEAFGGTYQNQDLVIDMESLLSNFQKDHGLIYFTLTVSKLNNNNIFYILTAEDIQDEKTYKICEVEEDKLQHLKLDSIRILKNHSAGMEKQQKILGDYGAILGLNADKINNKNYLVIPNGLSLDIPVHMAYMNGEYLYENTSFSYLPNIHLASRTAKTNNRKYKAIAFYNSGIENSKCEAKIIEDILGKDSMTIFPNPTLNEVKKMCKGKEIVHVVAHQENGKINFKDHEIVAVEFVNALPDDLELVVLNICKGGEISKMTGYPINHKSLAHYLLAKNVRHVITNTWDLGQDASFDFSGAFYNNFMKTKKLNEYPLLLKNRTPQNMAVI